jgi:hypothetical protein
MDAIDRTHAWHLIGTSAFDRKTCVRTHILQNWPPYVKYKVVDL